MKKLFLLFLFLQLCKPIVALAQFNASQIKKDGVTIKGNASNQLMVDTSNVATKLYVQNQVSGGGSSAWGGITGTLSNQTDLQSALNAKLSLSDTASMLTRYLRSNSATLLYEPIISSGTTGQYWRGDKSWQTLNSTAVGLGNVPNLDATNPSNTVQTSSFRYVTDAEKSTWNAKQSAITTGTTLQYFRGDLSLATFPTNVSSFTNDAGYITSSGVTPAALTKVDDTNVTLTLGGTPSTALLQAASLTLGWTGTLADGRIASASTWNAKESALTFSTGLTRSTNTITVNTSQNIATISNLTSNGFVKTSGGTGALSIDGNTYFNVANNLSEGTAATMRTNLGLGTIATQAANSVSITGGSVTGITDLTVADGGTGASDMFTAQNNIGFYTLRPSGNVTTTANTATDITGMSMTAAANSVYVISGGFQTGCNNTGGLVMACTIPSGTMSLGYSGISSAGNAFAAALATASGTLTTSTRAWNTVNSSAGYVSVNGTITTGGSGGTLKFQYASVTAGQTSTIFQEGTFVQITKVQ